MARVLVIEASKRLRDIYAAALKDAGYDADISSSAQTAVNVADKHRPDLVLLELQLGRHNGIEFLYEFRSYPEWQDVPVIIHSIVPPTEFQEDSIVYKKLKISAYLYKPHTSLQKLLRTVDSELKNLKIASVSP
jgi:DNA-binding response OmpR family regulator